MNVTVYDGATTIGGTKIHLQEGEDGLFFGFGKKTSSFFISQNPPKVSSGEYSRFQIELPVS